MYRVSRSRFWRQGWTALLVTIAVAGLYLTLGTWLAFSSGVQIDEPAHFVAAIAIWDQADFDSYPQNSPLPHCVAGVPLAVRGLRLDRNDEAEAIKVVPVARATMHQLPAELNLDLALARIAMLFFGIFGAWGIYWLTALLWGKRAAAGAVAFWCLNPVVLTSSASLSHDVAGAAAALWALLATAAFIWRPDIAGAVFAGVMWSIAVLCRPTHILPALIVPALVTIVVLRKRPGPRFTAALAYGALTALTLLIGVNAGYLFQRTCRPLGEILRSPRAAIITAHLFGTRPRLERFAQSAIGAVPVPLPRTLVEGLLLQAGHFRTWSPPPGSRFQPGYWWWIEGNARKMPVGLLIYSGVGLLTMALKLRRGFTRQGAVLAAVLLAWLAYYGWVLSCPGRSIPFLRYSIPVISVLSVLLSGPLESPSRVVRLAATMALIVGATEVLLAFPHTASFFNGLFGGIEAAVGRVALQDLDNGQDTPYAVRWAQEHPHARPLRVLLPMCFSRSEDVWGPGVTFDGPASPNEWVLASIALGAYGDQVVIKGGRRRRVARPAPALLVLSPAMPEHATERPRPDHSRR